jgi:hypothetical protein
MASKRKSIDLLNPINPPSDLWTSIYNWVFKIGRYILVGVEALLLIAFFSRFVLDEVNNDLTKEINDKVNIISNAEFRSKEIKFQNIHTLLQDVQVISKKQDINSEIVAQVTSGVPDTLVMENFSFNNDKVSMNIKTSSIKSIKDYEFSLRQNNLYKDIIVTISKTSTKTDELDVKISFLISKKE